MAFNECITSELFQDKEDIYKVLINLSCSKLFDQWKFTDSFEDILYDFSTFSNTMSYFSLYNVFEIEDLINIGVTEKEKMTLF